MRQYAGVAIGLVVGTVLGAGAVGVLRAQTKAPAYVVSEIDVTNPQAYAKEYSPKVQAVIRAAGGRTIALGGNQGAGAKNLRALEGDPPKRVAIQEWPSMDALNAWWNGADYKAARAIGDKYAKFRIFAVDSVNLGK